MKEKTTKVDSNCNFLVVSQVTLLSHLNLLALIRLATMAMMSTSQAGAANS
jgi:hypothetical protein